MRLAPCRPIPGFRRQAATQSAEDECADLRLLTAAEVDRLSPSELRESIAACQREVAQLEAEIFAHPDLCHPPDPADEAESAKLGGTTWQCPEHSVAIRADVRVFDFCRLGREQRRLGAASVRVAGRVGERGHAGGRLFDIIMMDPPWRLASANPTRGVSIRFPQLADDMIRSLPLNALQEDGFLFLWVINAKYRLALELIDIWGYKLVDTLVWVKQTVNRRLASGHGFYLQHAKETCLIALKGELPATWVPGVCSDVIFSQRRGQSQKPAEVYEYAEQMMPNGFFLEIFGRRNNLRDQWVTIGDEL